MRVAAPMVVALFALFALFAVGCSSHSPPATIAARPQRRAGAAAAPGASPPTTHRRRCTGVQAPGRCPADTAVLHTTLHAVGRSRRSDQRHLPDRQTDRRPRCARSASTMTIDGVHDSQ
jgi:hypothetical protein